MFWYGVGAAITAVFFLVDFLRRPSACLGLWTMVEEIEETEEKIEANPYNSYGMHYIKLSDNQLRRNIFQLFFWDLIFLAVWPFYWVLYLFVSILGR